MGNTLTVLRKGYDQSFNIPAPTLTEKNLPDQSGKVFIITGANSGVGYHLSSLLYGRNGTVYMACRSAEKANEAISAIKKAHPSSQGKVIFLQLNLSDLSSIRASVDEFLSKESKLHWLNNNAGVMVPPVGSKSTQGYDLQIATNVLGPFLFTSLLLPVLKKTASTEAPGSVRVSWAGSSGIDLLSPPGGVKFKKNDKGEDVVAEQGGNEATYGATKAANYLLAREFGRRGVNGNGDGILHTSYNPGNLQSGLQTHVTSRPVVGLIATAFFKLILYPGHMGAYTELYAGLSPDITLQDQGKYVIPWGRKAYWIRPDVEDAVGDGKSSDLLYAWCERETKPFVEV